MYEALGGFVSETTGPQRPALGQRDACSGKSVGIPASVPKRTELLLPFSPDDGLVEPGRLVLSLPHEARPHPVRGKIPPRRQRRPDEPAGAAS